jgi:hypothetical protein
MFYLGARRKVPLPVDARMDHPELLHLGLIALLLELSILNLIAVFATASVIRLVSRTTLRLLERVTQFVLLGDEHGFQEGLRIEGYVGSILTIAVRLVPPHMSRFPTATHR